MVNLANQKNIKRWAVTPHALERMEERRISNSELRAIIEAPDDWIAQGGKWIAAKRFDKRSDNSLAAVLLERKEHDLWLVLTVMVHFQRKK